MKIQFIGCGKIGEILLASIMSHGSDKNEIFVKTKTSQTQSRLQTMYPIQVGLNSQVDVIVLAVKPGQFEEVDLTMFSGKNICVLSLMAGVTLKKIQQKLSGNRILRIMPNTPIQVGKGVIGYYSQDAGSDDEALLETIFGHLGCLIACHTEDEIDKITALSGSGPAYFYYFTQIMHQIAREMGFSQEQAQKITYQTFLGSAQLLQESQESVETLRQNITSKGGTTQKAIETFELGGLEELVQKAIDSAYQRAKELNN